MADMIEGSRGGKSSGPREEKMGKIYVVIGFEVSDTFKFFLVNSLFYLLQFIRILLKGIQHNFRYQLAAIELYYRE